MNEKKNNEEISNKEMAIKFIDFGIEGIKKELSKIQKSIIQLNKNKKLLIWIKKMIKIKT